MRSPNMYHAVSRASALLALLLFGSLLLPSASVYGQGFLIIHSDDIVRLPRPIIIYPPHPRPRPEPEVSYKIKELSVQAKVEDQVAKVQVSQAFENTGSRQIEVSFVFPLPYDGAVDRLTLLVDGKEYPAKLLDKEKAREMYEEIVRKNKDPALLEWMGTGLFKTSVFPVPAGEKRTVTLRYSQICRTDQGLTEFLFPLSTAKFTSPPLEKLSIDVSIESSSQIKNVYSPSHEIKVKRPDNKHATVTYTAKDKVPTSDFRLFYDVGEGKVGTSVVSYRPDADQDGYFLLLASPEIEAEQEERPKKTVIFVVDRSGSMAGKKIEQAKEALKFVLNNLRKGDTFNIIAYDSEIESFRPELQKYNEQTRQAAQGFIEGVYAGGSTNISGALDTALSQLPDQQRPTYVLFLTDGLPTAGETNEAKIVAEAQQENDVRARLFAFGVGYDVNSRLLDKLARVNYGQSQYVRPNEDIEDSVSKLYNRIGAPVMTGVELAVDVERNRESDGPAINRRYPQELYDLFAGEQLVVVGRYKTPGQAKVTISGKVGDQKQKMDFAAKLVKKSKDETNAFVEKIWAMRRVGEIIDQIDLEGKNEELVEELVRLSKKHGIITPYTSFLADENADRNDLADARRRADASLDMLAETAGKKAFGQRQLKGNLQRAAQAPAADGAIGGAGAGQGGGVRYYSTEQDKEVVVDTVQRVGSKTFYREGDQWVDESVSEEEQKNAKQIERYSKAYFDLVSKHGKDAAKYLAMEGNVIVKLNGQVYRF